jgi:hypothetical protein
MKFLSVGLGRKPKLRATNEAQSFRPFSFRKGKCNPIERKVMEAPKRVLTKPPKPRDARSTTRVQTDGKTKFDKWLEAQAERQAPLLFSFAIPPRNDNRVNSVVTIRTVDRYMLNVTFEDGEDWWIQKSIVCGVRGSSKRVLKFQNR